MDLLALCAGLIALPPIFAQIHFSVHAPTLPTAFCKSTKSLPLLTPATAFTLLCFSFTQALFTSLDTLLFLLNYYVYCFLSLFSMPRGAQVMQQELNEYLRNERAGACGFPSLERCQSGTGADAFRGQATNGKQMGVHMFSFHAPHGHLSVQSG